MKTAEYKEHLAVYYKGELSHYINPYLLEKQKAWGKLETIKELHEFRLVIHSMIQETKGHNKLASLVRDLTEIEFKLQQLWGFKRDGRFHKWWNTPMCTCPKMDNEDSYPSGNYVVTKDCLLHGWE